MSHWNSCDTEEKKKYWREARKKKERNPAGKTCLCSRPAMKWYLGGWVCKECWDIEQKLSKNTVVADSFSDK